MAQNPPLTVGKMWEIFHKGQYYNPAYKHYPNLGLNSVSCDRCQKQNIESWWGYENYDLCMTCYGTLNAEQKTHITTTPTHPICKYPPTTNPNICICPEPPMTKPTIAICPQHLDVESVKPPDYTTKF